VDILLVLLLTLITIPVVEFTDGIARIILGVITLLIAPGYSLMAALFPNRSVISSIERAGLTFVLSFAIVSLSGLALNFTPWGIRLTPVLITTEIIVLLCLAVAFWRRTRLPESERFVPKISLGGFRWSSINRLDRFLYAGLAVVVIGSLVTLGYVIAQPKNPESFTNFYMLGPEGKMENYPRQVALASQVPITLAIENHEKGAASYAIDIMFDGVKTDTIGPLSLADEQKWSDLITLTPSKAGLNQQVEFWLFKDGSTTPYSTLRLWLDVTG
jgi:uncharacterized membrane protein